MTAAIQQALFLVLAATALGGAIGVVTARSVFVSALWLILSFAGVAGLYVLLEAGFLAVIQLLIYVGAISVLILFAIMVTRQVMGGGQLSNSQWYLAAIVAVMVFGVLASLGFRAEWPLTTGGVLPADGGQVVASGAAGGGPAGAEAPALAGVIEAPAPAGGTVLVMPGPVERIGRAFVTEHLLAFEVISAILLVALIGAVVIARE